MASLAVVRPYVEKLLADFCGTDALVVDADGDVPIRKGSTMYWVTLEERGGDAQVRIWSYLARDVPPSPELFEHINDLNATMRFGRVYAAGGDVVISHELLADHLDPDELHHACAWIGATSDAHDDDLVARFGGRVAFPA